MPRQKTKKRQLHIVFPLGGLNRAASFRQQPPYTSPDLLNVRARDPMDNRERGGSRPGLMNSHVDDIGSNVRFLEPMILNLGDDFTSFSDTFGGLSLAAAWTQASWASASPSILPSAFASVDTSVDDAAVVLDTLPIDTTETYTVEKLIIPWAGAHHGTYRLFLRMDNTTPLYTDEGVMVELTMTGTDGSYAGYLKSYTGGVETSYALTSGTLSSDQAGWFSVTVAGDTLTVRWCGVTLLTQAIDDHGTKSRVGFGMECTVDGGICLTRVFRAQYYSTETVDTLRTMLVGSASGDIWRETSYGRMTKVTSTLTVRDDTMLTAAQSGQKLYIADYGDLRVTGTDGTVAGAVLSDVPGTMDWSTYGIDPQDDVVVISDATGPTELTYEIDSVAAGGVTLTAAPGNGTCSYRIERGPKVYDPDTNTISLYIADAGEGQVPTGCPLICRYLNRIVLAGAEIAPHVWYMSRWGDELDWDYAETDAKRAVAGTASEAGVPGTAITALVPHSDDYLIMGCRNALWRLRGDPAYGGSLDAISYTVGIIGPNAWCLGPAGELIFLSLDGVYILPPGGESHPISMSREVLPQELLNLNPDEVDISLEYDVNGRGVDIFLTPNTSNTRVHWWFDWDTKTFWPMTLSADHEPTATCAMQSTAIEDTGVILGCRDGYLRRFTTLMETDCGTAFDSYAMFGPIPLAVDSRVGSVIALDAVMAADSGDVTWATYPALTYEGSLTASSSDTGTWSAGLNASDWVACRGQAFILKLTGSSGRRWGFEQVTATIRDSGRRRLD